MPQAVGAVVPLGAGLFRPTKESDLCEAWRDAAKKWCDENNSGDKPEGRDFNRRYMEALEKRNPDYARQFDPEVITGVQRKVGDVTVEHAGLEALKQGGSFGGTAGWERAAGILEDRWLRFGCEYLDGAMGQRGMRSALNKRVSGLFNKVEGQASGIHADATLRDGTSVELKGPFDKPGTDQYEKEVATAKNGELLIIDNIACDPDATIVTPKNNCISAKKKK